MGEQQQQQRHDGLSTHRARAQQHGHRATHAPQQSAVSAHTIHGCVVVIGRIRGIDRSGRNFEGKNKKKRKKKKEKKQKRRAAPAAGAAGCVATVLEGCELRVEAPLCRTALDACRRPLCAALHCTRLRVRGAAVPPSASRTALHCAVPCTHTFHSLR